jgi:hypothetical protein
LARRHWPRSSGRDWIKRCRRSRHQGEDINRNASLHCV